MNVADIFMGEEAGPLLYSFVKVGNIRKMFCVWVFKLLQSFCLRCVARFGNENETGVNVVVQVFYFCMHQRRGSRFRNLRCLWCNMCQIIYFIFTSLCAGLLTSVGLYKLCLLGWHG